MARVNRSAERRRELIPTIAATFAELGYRRTTTALLARRSGAQEPVLYRLWPDKRAMFVAAIEHVYDRSMQMWGELLAAADDRRSEAERLIEYESTHHGEFGLYRIVFAGLNETDDPEIRSALRDMYRRYRKFIVERIEQHRGGGQGVATALTAWAILGLGTITSIGRELGLLAPDARRRLWREIGPLLLEGPMG